MKNHNSLKLVFLMLFSFFLIAGCSDDSSTTTIYNNSELYSIVPSTSSINLATGGSETITATVQIVDSDNNDVTASTDYSISYNGDEGYSNIISIEQNGNSATITAIAEGTTSITVSLLIKDDSVENNSDEDNTSEDNASENYVEVASTSVDVVVTAASFNLRQGVLSAFSDEFIANFKAGGSESDINASDIDTVANIQYILTAFANSGVGSVTRDGLASSFGRIVAEAVSTDEACSSSSSSLGCVLSNYISTMSIADFPSEFDNLVASYSTTFSSIISNLTNLNSQSDNIKGLADVLEERVNSYDEASLSQKIINKLYYATSYLVYNTLMYYCANNTGSSSDTCSGKAGEHINIPSDIEETGIFKSCMTSSGYTSNGVCEGGEGIHILDKEAIADANAYVEGSGSWVADGVTFTSSGSMTTYSEVYYYAGSGYAEACEYFNEYIQLYLTSSSSISCTFSRTSYLTSSVQGIVKAIHDIISDMDSNKVDNINLSNTISKIYEATDYEVDGELASAFTTTTSSYSNVINFTNYAYEIYTDGYYQDEIPAVDTTGTRNIYYFITAFINGLNNSNENSYLYGYSFISPNKSSTLPSEIEIIEKEDSLYTALSEAFTTGSDNIISLGTLSTTTTADFTNGSNGNSIVENILSATKSNVINVLQDYNVVVSVNNN